jgi:hypothetical protein
MSLSQRQVLDNPHNQKLSVKTDDHPFFLRSPNSYIPRAIGGCLAALRVVAEQSGTR